MPNRRKYGTMPGRPDIIRRTTLGGMGNALAADVDGSHLQPGAVASGSVLDDDLDSGSDADAENGRSPYTPRTTGTILRWNACEVYVFDPEDSVLEVQIHKPKKTPPPGRHAQEAVQAKGRL